MNTEEEIRQAFENYRNGTILNQSSKTSKERWNNR